MITPEQTVSLLIAGGIFIVCVTIFYMWLMADMRKKHKVLRAEVDELKRRK